MKFSLFNVWKLHSDNTFDGVWLQNFVGTYEEALARALSYDKKYFNVKVTREESCFPNDVHRFALKEYLPPEKASQ